MPCLQNNSNYPRYTKKNTKSNAWNSGERPRFSPSVSFLPLTPLSIPPRTPCRFSPSLFDSREVRFLSAFLSLVRFMLLWLFLFLLIVAPLYRYIYTYERFPPVEMRSRCRTANGVRRRTSLLRGHRALFMRVCTRSSDTHEVCREHGPDRRLLRGIN